MAQRSLLNSKPSLFPLEIKNFAARLLKDHPDAVAAGICALLVLLGWLALHFNWVGLAILVLSAAYVIGG
nr:hypothetical protein [Pleurocapsa sp. PCC 7327]